MVHFCLFNFDSHHSLGPLRNHASGLLALASQSAADSAIESVLDRVVCASRQQLRYFRPMVAEFLLRLEDDLFLLFSPRVLADAGVEVVVPTLPALLSRPARYSMSLLQLLRYLGPALHPEGLH